MLRPSHSSLIWGIVPFLCFIVASPASSVVFDQVARPSGIVHVFGGWLGGGVAVEDFDNDGDFDVVLAGSAGQPNRLFENLGIESGRTYPTFSDITTSAGLSDIGHTKGVVFADYDNDGLPDLFLTTYDESPDQSPDPTFVSSITLYRNNGDKTFTDVTQTAGLTRTQVQGFGLALADIDRDGWLDLVTTNRGATFETGGPNYLFHNNGDGTFSDISASSGIGATLRKTLQAGFFDYDNDGDQDLYLATDKHGGNQLFRNDGNLNFTDVSAVSGSDIEMDGMCVTTGDLDNDGDLDLFITNTQAGHALLINNGDGTFVNWALLAGVTGGRVGWGAEWLDFDNDMLLDLYVVASTLPPENQLFKNLGDGTFRDDASVSGCVNPEQSYGMSVADFDLNGHLDFLVSNLDGDAALFMNRGTARNSIAFKLIGMTSNWDAVGARLRLFVGQTVQIREVTAGGSYLSAHPKEISFGMGTATAPTKLEVTWPNGGQNTFTQLSAGNRYRIVEGFGIQTKTILLSHSVQEENAQNTLRWATVSWPDENEFRVRRHVRQVVIPGEHPGITLGVLPAGGRNHQFVDTGFGTLDPGVYHYEIFVAGTSGERLLWSSDPIEIVEPPLPVSLRIGQNFPNPFRASTLIPLEIPQGTSNPSVRVFNLKGELVARIPVAATTSETTIQIDRSTLRSTRERVPAGVYYYQLFVGDNPTSLRFKMILLP